jgi:murein DD-endopeptidase MepM/ murein hydrolase activator NlpD
MLGKLLVCGSLILLAAPGAELRATIAPTSAAPDGSAVVYAAPVPPPSHVLRPFDPPTTPYGPGHLGVDLQLGPGAEVTSAADGVVRFAGSVAGRGVVDVQHRDGISTEYEPVTPLVRIGATVTRGEVIATLRGHHPGCAVSCLHWGARRGPTYLDPLGLLDPLGPVVLLPWTPTG